MLFGVAYYHEYQPYERLAQDIQLMRAAGISCVRLGESTWSSWEPSDGQFTFAWMERVIDALHEAGIKVILGTPTYAIPAWLYRQHPEIMARTASGHYLPYGTRQEMDISHPAYRFYAERLIRALAQHFAAHPGIIGFQVDNETGPHMLYNDHIFQRFLAWLQEKFGSVERLNEVWGLTYWSHRLSDWHDLWRPEGNTTPGYDLAWRTFQASLVTEFLSWQAAIVREYARPDQFITTCLEGGHGRVLSDRYQIAQSMDISAENPYHVTQDGMEYLPAAAEQEQLAPIWQEQGGGGWMLSLNGDLGRSGQQRNFLITELNGLSTLGAHSNYPAYDGQWRLAAYTYLARGANSLAYWHWHTCHYGHETYWQGILNHDLEPNRCYREICRIGAELQQAGELLTDLEIDADVALLYSQASKYALEFQPCLPEVGSTRADKGSYQRIFNTFYRAFYDARAQTAIVHPEQDFTRFPVLVVPALYIADDGLLERLLAYARQGGHLLLTFRTAYADEYARARWRKAPGVFRQALGVSYNEFSHLSAPLRLQAVPQHNLDLPAEARACAWADGLELEGATPLAYYDHPHFGRFPAIVTRPHGKGSITYCGTLPDRSLGQALASWLLSTAGIEAPGAHLPDAVRVSGARLRDGRHAWFISNWSATPLTLVGLPWQGVELFQGTFEGKDKPLELAAWDIKIIVA
jgi:beta-galactosidase